MPTAAAKSDSDPHSSSSSNPLMMTTTRTQQLYYFKEEQQQQQQQNIAKLMVLHRSMMCGGLVVALCVWIVLSSRRNLSYGHLWAVVYVLLKACRRDHKA